MVRCCQLVPTTPADKNDESKKLSHLLFLKIWAACCLMVEPVQRVQGPSLSVPLWPDYAVL